MSKMKKYAFFIFAVVSFFPICGDVIDAADDKEILYNEADVYFEKGMYRKAEEEYKNIIEIYPDYAPAYNNLGIISSMDPAKTKESVLYFLKAATIDPNYASPYRNLGIICYKIRELEKAVAYFKKAIELDPGNSGDFFNMGWIFMVGMGKTELAVDFFKKAIELKEDYAEPHYALGLAYITLNKKGSVIDEITELRFLRREDLAGALEDYIRPTDTGKPIDMTQNLQVDTEYSMEGGREIIESKGRITGNATISITLKGAGGAVSQKKQ